MLYKFALTAMMMKKYGIFSSELSSPFFFFFLFKNKIKNKNKGKASVEMSFRMISSNFRNLSLLRNLICSNIQF